MSTSNKQQLTLNLAVKAARKSELKKKYKSFVLKRNLTTEVHSYVQKLNDDPGVVDGSRVDQYWHRNTIKLIAHNYFDPGKVKKLDRKVRDPETIVKRFSLRGMQFGNWLNQQDRYNYMYAIGLSLYDMKEILNLPFDKLGFKKKLTIGMGSRGSGSALAHFEPRRMAINITRFTDQAAKPMPKGLKTAAMLNSGGAGAFSHEWAHALDYYLGGQRNFISGGGSTRYLPNKDLMKLKGPAGSMERLLFKINCNSDGSKSEFRKNLEQIRKKNNGMGNYFMERTEIFARVFEMYCSEELRKIGGKNTFISQSKYKSNVYPTRNNLTKVIPEIKELLTYYRKM